MLSPRIATILTTVALFSTQLNADFVGLNIGSSFWNPDLAGSFKSNSGSSKISAGSNVDVEPAINISFEHPIPTLPNIKFQNRELSSNANDSSASIDFNGTTFTGGVSSTLDLSHRDIVLYYELLDNWVNLDFGLNLKTFDGEVTVANNLNNESITVDETIPLVYLSARFDLPFSGFYIGADIQNLSLNDSSVEDSTLMIGYENSSGFGIEGGYKKFNLDLNDASNLDTEIEYDGLFINGYIHF